MVVIFAVKMNFKINLFFFNIGPALLPVIRNSLAQHHWENGLHSFQCIQGFSDWRGRGGELGPMMPQSTFVRSENALYSRKKNIQHTFSMEDEPSDQHLCSLCQNRNLGCLTYRCLSYDVPTQGGQHSWLAAASKFTRLHSCFYLWVKYNTVCI